MPKLLPARLFCRVGTVRCNHEVQVFQRSFLRALSQFLIREGGVWDADVSDGWSWVYGTFSTPPGFVRYKAAGNGYLVRTDWNV